MGNTQNLITYLTPEKTMQNKKMIEALKSVEPLYCAAAVINLNNLVENYRDLKSQLCPGTVIGAVLKADAYGFGAIPVGKVLYKEGCRDFFVATAKEGIEVREVVGDDAKIYTLIGMIDGCEQFHYDYNIVPVLNNLHQIEIWSDFSKKIGKRLDAAVQIDTGMNRNGIKENEAIEFHQKIKESFNLLFILSHLACADDLKSKMNTLQLSKFKKMLKLFGENTRGSLSATNGIFLGYDYQFDIVRPGKGLYGFSIREDKVGSLKPVMDIYAKVIQIDEVLPGESIGYGATFVANKKMKTITVGLGYADGFMRKFYGFGYGFFNGKRISVVGRISMDYIVLDASEIDDIKIGDWVAFTSSEYTLEKWALELKTLPHEVACKLGPRIKKVYIGG